MVVSSDISDLYSTRPGLTSLDLINLDHISLDHISLDHISLAASGHFIALSTKGGIVFP
jgi:hypothetical protein